MTGDDKGGGTDPSRWLQLQDDLLRGLAHALANRVGVVSGTADLLGVSAAPSPSMIGALRGAADRLEALLPLLRALPRQPGGAELVVVAEALALAEALVVYHPALDGRPLQVTRPSAPAVVRAPQDAVVHALCLALVGAAAADPEGAVAVEWTEGAVRGGEGTAITVRARGRGAWASGADLAALRWLMARAPGVQVDGVDGGACLRLPPVAPAPSAAVGAG